MTDVSPNNRNPALSKPSEIKITPPVSQQQELRQPPLIARLSSYSGSSNGKQTSVNDLAQSSSAANSSTLGPASGSSSSASASAPAAYNNGGSPRSRRSSHIPNASTSPSRNRSNSSPGDPDLVPTPSHHQPAHIVTRQRRSSSLIQHLEPDTLDTKIDQALNPNVNANWVHQKGAWIIHIVIIILLKISYNFISVLDNDWKWTLTNLTYDIGSYIMFHQVKGTPFEFNSGAYDNLTMWEQIDNGDQYTPTKKFLMLVPIGLFLVSTHYSRYNLYLFLLNGLSCLCVVVPKLAFAHRLRVTLF
ncbi:uncharacterized protein LODBEIA_P40720 [Lodderomyces beijingensis]|uniref:Protein ORM1 n=1 Tax=Lodderomyces beijingensis TaxID=1775926 RepID=A0ABP0ZNX4_9ASCO